MLRHLFILILCFLIPGMLHAEEKVDSTADYSFQWKKTIVPAACIAVGAWGVDNGFLVKKKRQYDNWIGEQLGTKRKTFDNYMQYAPLVMYFGMQPLGAKTKHEFRERLCIGANSYLLVLALTQGPKHIINERRPDSSKNNSFPSGHTATAFCGAELVRLEYGGWYGTSAYALATLTAFMRTYNHRHWLNDLVAGAGIGILSARVGSWLMPMERHLFGWDKKEKAPAMMAMPYYSSFEGGQIGASMAVVF